MRNYFYIQNNEQIGPINLNDLTTLINSKQVFRDTMVWYEGLESWTQASNISELQSLFKISTPPPQPTQTTHTPPPQTTPYHNPYLQTKKKRRGRFLFWLLPLLLIGGVAFYVFQQNEKARMKSYEGVYPSSRLKLSNVEFKPRLLEGVLKGTVSNVSQSTTYGEVDIEIIWYDKNKKTTSSKSFRLNKLVYPGLDTKFKFNHVKPIKGKNFHVRIKDARVIKQR